MAKKLNIQWAGGGRLRRLTPNPKTIFEDLTALSPGSREKTALKEERRRKTLDANRISRQRDRLEYRDRMRDKAATGRRVKFGDRRQDKVVLTMEPGAWYAMNDVLRAAGLPAHGCSTFDYLRNAGDVERVANPKWVPGVSAFIRVAAGNEPQWLVRLTAKGEGVREALQRLGGTE